MRAETFEVRAQSIGETWGDQMDSAQQTTGDA
jgi:hypothetical protein